MEKESNYQLCIGLLFGLCFEQAYLDYNVLIMFICLCLLFWLLRQLYISLKITNKDKVYFSINDSPKEDQCTRIMPYGKRCERNSRGYGHQGWCNTCEDSRYGY